MKKYLLFLALPLLSACGGDSPKHPVTSTPTTNTPDFNMKTIPAGTFSMGSNDGEDNEKPIHTVSLSSFQIGETEVTQAQWKAVMGTNRSDFKGDNLPVENVSWEDVQVFLQKLNNMSGKSYRLPTEAEWEYAALGGQFYKYAGSDSLDAVAWYDGNSGSKTHSVKQKNANGYGLYDMTGNVSEWCSDWFMEYSWSMGIRDYMRSHRVLRGGSWDDSPQNCRAASRCGITPSRWGRDYRFGFRVACSL